MPSIHLIRNDPGLPPITPVEPGSQVYQSGYWAVSPSKASSLIGGQIFFHEHQTGPAFFGGFIQEFEQVQEGQYTGRVLFTFRADAACKGTTTPRRGWGQEMKIVE